ncbi:putative serine protease PepD [Prauserella shujinwangii]|uniref:Putative serine protease PepD n=1 Tax=Prauserella shujinwangii TaxID=1453103 RepID=A0A2T0LZ62_9PSEU|nr:trypsin-like peptidase domain-containing protein [Prauserella shujinwangii]PRX49416.1 putative serine protease PepD [Prauserella shujinwangii]
MDSDEYTREQQPPAADPAGQAPPRRPRRVVVLASAAAVVAALAGGASGAALVTSVDRTGDSTVAIGSATARAASTSTDVGTVAEQVLPSVVQVNVRTAQGEAIGSGVVLTEDGRILTNAHVIDGATGDVTITLSDGTRYQAAVLGADATADIAVLQARDASGLAPARLGDSSSVRVGEQVVAVGSPGGLQNTVTSGIVSAVGRTLSEIGRQDEQPSPFGRPVSSDASAGPGYTAIQTDAAINHGNSGGPLVNRAGAVIGINSAIYSPSGSDSGNVGIGFAIPINDAKAIVAAIEARS